VVNIFTLDGILDVDRALAFSQHSGVWCQEGTTNLDDVVSPGNQNGRKGDDQTQTESREEEAHGEELCVMSYGLWAIGGVVQGKMRKRGSFG
jgi:hypothetical protein